MRWIIVDPQNKSFILTCQAQMNILWMLYGRMGLLLYHIVTCNPSTLPTPSPTHNPFKRPTPSPTSDPSNGPTASPIATRAPSNGPTALPTNDPSAGLTANSPTNDPSMGPTASPKEPTAPLHAVAQPTQSPTQSVTRNTPMLNSNHGSPDSVDMDTENSGGDALYIVLWIGAGILWVIVTILCFTVWKCRARKVEGVTYGNAMHEQDVIINITSTNATTRMNGGEDMIGTEFIASCKLDQDGNVKTIGGMGEDDHLSNVIELEGAKPNNVSYGNIQDDEFVIDGCAATKRFRNTDVETNGNIKDDEFVICGDDD
eukprot:1082018_1